VEGETSLTSLPGWLVGQVRAAFGLAPEPAVVDQDLTRTLLAWQASRGMESTGVVDRGVLIEVLGYDARPRLGASPGSLHGNAVHFGKPRGRWGLRQRRVRPRVFGEPAFECELVPEAVCPARPHVWAYAAWQQMVEAASADGVETRWLAIHAAYRSVAWQRQIFDYWLEERRKARAVAGQPPLEDNELRRQQRKWTAEPGQSAHHTGFALDLKLYDLKRRSKHHPVYHWLAQRAASFGFYPYFPEGWHWEYNPPGILARLAALRRGIRNGTLDATELESLS
jgi:hypothetical protein